MTDQAPNLSRHLQQGRALSKTELDELILAQMHGAQNVGMARNPADAGMQNMWRFYEPPAPPPRAPTIWDRLRAVFR